MMKLNEEQKNQYNELGMPEKVAILLIQLGEDATANIFSHMEIDTVTEISKYIATVKNIDKQVANAVLEEFYALLQSNQYIRSGGMEYAKEILFRTFGAEAAQKILEKLSKTMESTQNFGYLSQIKPQQLSDFIINEHPQTIALILAHMDPTRAAETLSFFTDELRSEVTIRMANLGEISPSVVKRVSTVLENKLESLTSYKVEVGGPRAVAEILNRLGQKASKTTISFIEQSDESLASTIKEMMFTFEDIVKLDNNGIREILKVVDKKDLMVALKGSSEDLKKQFMDNMSQRAQDAFIEEMNFLGAVRVKDVEEAQRRIVEEVQKLAEQGVVQIGEAEEMIE
ncbi:flagellar motor switch protein FliG [Sulfurospirillum sp. 1612]|uniref:flagellar motor switch protein FliG n=1 Tax=Sulfurospirillum sp. 1612 TaxID=3094835 RepID=UPI002F948915